MQSPYLITNCSVHSKFLRPLASSDNHSNFCLLVPRIQLKTPTPRKKDHTMTLTVHCTRCQCISWKWACQAISVCLFSITLVAQAVDYPSASIYACEDVQNYYASVHHLKGLALKKRLHSIVAAHRSLSYKEVWNALEILDAADVDNPNASQDIVEIYSLKAVPKKLAGKPEGWNMNSSRGNKYFGECTVMLSSKCQKPANKEAAMDTETDKEIWAPPLQVRGDVARALMYMAVCYGIHEPGGGPNIYLSDSPSMGRWKDDE